MILPLESADPKIFKTVLDYPEMFRFKGSTLFVLHTWICGYQGLGAGIIVKAGEGMYALPRNQYPQIAQAGLEFFSDEAKFSDYVTEFEQFCTEFVSFLENFPAHPSKTQTAHALELFCRIFFYWHKNEFFFVDLAASKAFNNAEIMARLRKNYELKEKYRIRIINNGYYHEQAYSRRILNALSTQFNVPLEDLEQYSIHELLALYDGEKVPRQTIIARNQAMILISENGLLQFLAGEDAHRISAQYFGNIERQINKETQLKGMCAYKGQVRGPARIIVSDMETSKAGLQLQIDRMRKGDILVAENTSPEYLPALKKAGAILTNQGGLLSHAAVMCREFKIPCIIGLKHATQIFKNADLLEVDATTGIVKKIVNRPLSDDSA